MEGQLIRHRATRKSVIGTLYIEDFECFTLERRDDMLDVGQHQVFDSKPLMIGDHPVTDRERKDGISGQLILGLAATRLRLSETGKAYRRFIATIAPALTQGEPINVEVIDEVDYEAEANS